MDPLPPLPPLPPLQSASDRETAEERRKPGKALLSWATAIALLTALVVGILHGVGAKLFDESWRVFTGHG